MILMVLSIHLLQSLFLKVFLGWASLHLLCDERNLFRPLNLLNFNWFILDYILNVRNWRLSFWRLTLWFFNRGMHPLVFLFIGFLTILIWFWCHLHIWIFSLGLRLVFRLSWRSSWWSACFTFTFLRRLIILCFWRRTILNDRHCLLRCTLHCLELLLGLFRYFSLGIFLFYRLNMISLRWTSSLLISLNLLWADLNTFNCIVLLMFTWCTLIMVLIFNSILLVFIFQSGWTLLFLVTRIPCTIFLLSLIIFRRFHSAIIHRTWRRRSTTVAVAASWAYRRPFTLAALRTTTWRFIRWSWTMSAFWCLFAFLLFLVVIFH